MTFVQFLVTSLLGVTVYAFGVWRGLKQGFRIGQGAKPQHVGRLVGTGLRCDCSDCWCRYGH